MVWMYFGQGISLCKMEKNEVQDEKTNGIKPKVSKTVSFYHVINMQSKANVMIS